MIKGTTITLITKVQTGTDPFRQPIYEDAEISVEDVLVGQPTTDDIQNAQTVYGKIVTYVLCIPKGDTNTWEDAEVILPEPFGGRYKTIGRPTALIESNIPKSIKWNKQVKIERITG